MSAEFGKTEITVVISTSKDDCLTVYQHVYRKPLAENSVRSGIVFHRRFSSRRFSLFFIHFLACAPGAVAFEFDFYTPLTGRQQQSAQSTSQAPTHTSVAMSGAPPPRFGEVDVQRAALRAHQARRRVVPVRLPASLVAGVLSPPFHFSTQPPFLKAGARSGKQKHGGADEDEDDAVSNAESITSSWSSHSDATKGLRYAPSLHACFPSQHHPAHLAHSATLCSLTDLKTTQPSRKHPFQTRRLARLPRLVHHCSSSSSLPLPPARQFITPLPLTRALRLPCRIPTHRFFSHRVQMP